jgi:hypothetical protein
MYWTGTLRIKQMELDYTAFTDQELAKALAGNHAAIQNYWTQLSELAVSRGRPIDESIASLIKNIERLEEHNRSLREEASRRERFRSA